MSTPPEAVGAVTPLDAHAVDYKIAVNIDADDIDDSAALSPVETPTGVLPGELPPRPQNRTTLPLPSRCSTSGPVYRRTAPRAGSRGVGESSGSAANRSDSISPSPAVPSPDVRSSNNSFSIDCLDVSFGAESAGSLSGRLRRRVSWADEGEDGNGQRRSLSQVRTRDTPSPSFIAHVLDGKEESGEVSTLSPNGGGTDSPATEEALHSDKFLLFARMCIDSERGLRDEIGLNEKRERRMLGNKASAERLAILRAERKALETPQRSPGSSTRSTPDKRGEMTTRRAAASKEAGPNKTDAEADRKSRTQALLDRVRRKREESLSGEKQRVDSAPPSRLPSISATEEASTVVEPPSDPAYFTNPPATSQTPRELSTPSVCSTQLPSSPSLSPSRHVAGIDSGSEFQSPKPQSALACSRGTTVESLPAEVFDATSTAATAPIVVAEKPEPSSATLTTPMSEVEARKRRLSTLIDRKRLASRASSVSTPRGGNAVPQPPTVANDAGLPSTVAADDAVETPCGNDASLVTATSGDLTGTEEIAMRGATCEAISSPTDDPAPAVAKGDGDQLESSDVLAANDSQPLGANLVPMAVTETRDGATPAFLTGSDAPEEAAVKEDAEVLPPGEVVSSPVDLLPQPEFDAPAAPVLPRQHALEEQSRAELEGQIEDLRKQVVESHAEASAAQQEAQQWSKELQVQRRQAEEERGQLKHQVTELQATVEGLRADLAATLRENETRRAAEEKMVAELKVLQAELAAAATERCAQEAATIAAREAASLASQADLDEARKRLEELQRQLDEQAKDAERVTRARQLAEDRAAASLAAKDEECQQLTKALSTATNQVAQLSAAAEAAAMNSAAEEKQVVLHLRELLQAAEKKAMALEQSVAQATRDLEQEKENHRQAVQLHREERTALASEEQAKDRALEEAHRELAARDTRLKEVLADRAADVDVLLSTQESLSGMTVQLQSVKAEAEKEAATSARLKTEMGELRTSYETRLDELREALEQAQLEVDRARAEAEAQKQQHLAVTANQAIVMSSEAHLKSEVQRLSTELNDERQRRFSAEAEREVIRGKAEADALEVSTRMEAEHSRLRSALDEARSEAVFYKSQHDSIKQELRREREEGATKAAAAEATAVAKEQAAHDAESRAAAASASVEDVQHTLASLQKALEESSWARARAEGDVTRLERMLDQAKQSLRDAEEECRLLRQQQQGASRRIQEAEDAVAAERRGLRIQLIEAEEKARQYVVAKDLEFESARHELRSTAEDALSARVSLERELAELRKQLDSVVADRALLQAQSVYNPENAEGLYGGRRSLARSESREPPRSSKYCSTSARESSKGEVLHPDHLSIVKETDVTTGAGATPGPSSAAAPATSRRPAASRCGEITAASPFPSAAEAREQAHVYFQSHTQPNGGTRRVSPGATALGSSPIYSGATTPGNGREVPGSSHALGRWGAQRLQEHLQDLARKLDRALEAVTYSRDYSITQHGHVQRRREEAHNMILTPREQLLAEGGVSHHSQRGSSRVREERSAKQFIGNTSSSEGGDSLKPLTAAEQYCLSETTSRLMAAVTTMNAVLPYLVSLLELPVASRASLYEKYRNIQHALMMTRTELVQRTALRNGPSHPARLEVDDHAADTGSPLCDSYALLRRDPVVETLLTALLEQLPRVIDAFETAGMLPVAARVHSGGSSYVAASGSSYSQRYLLSPPKPTSLSTPRGIILSTVMTPVFVGSQTTGTTSPDNSGDDESLKYVTSGGDVPRDRFSGVPVTRSRGPSGDRDYRVVPSREHVDVSSWSTLQEPRNAFTGRVAAGDEAEYHWRPRGGVTGVQPSYLPPRHVFGAVGGRLRVSGGGQRLQRLLMPGVVDVMASSALGSLDHRSYFASLPLTSAVPPTEFAFSVRLGENCDDLLIGFADRYLPLESFVPSHNSLKYLNCYYLHARRGTLFCAGQGAVDVPYPGLRRQFEPRRGGRGDDGSGNAGDVITCILDVSARTIRYIYNQDDGGIAFHQVNVSRGLFPAFEVNSRGCTLEFV